MRLNLTLPLYGMWPHSASGHAKMPDMTPHVDARQAGRRLRAAMVLAGYPSMLALADQTGIPRYTIQRHMAGTSAPNINALATYAAALNVTIDYLVYGEQGDN